MRSLGNFAYLWIVSLIFLWKVENMKCPFKALVIAIFAFANLLVIGQDVDSLVKLLDPEIIDTNQVRIINKIGLKYYYASSNDTAKHYFLMEEKMATQLNDHKGIIDSWNNLGNVYGNMANDSIAIGYYDKALAKIAKDYQRDKSTIDVLTNRGVSYYFSGNINAALEDYILASELCRKNNFDKERGFLLNNLGIFYRALERYEEAIAIYKENYTLRKGLKDTMGMANTLLNQSVAYSFIEKPNESLESIYQARTLYEILKSEKDVFLCDIVIGTNLQELGQLDKALKVLAPIGKMKDPPLKFENKANLYLGLAEIYLAKNDLKNVAPYLNLIGDEILASDLIDYKIELLELKSNYAHKMAKDTEAYNHLIELNRLRSEKADIKNKELLKDTETKYLTIQKEQQIKILDSEKQLAESQLKVSNLRNVGLSVGLLIFGILSFVLKRLYDRLQKKNQIITKANQEKEILLKEIHHRVKNNLQTISSLLKLQSRYIKDENAVDALKSGLSRVNSMALIHKDLYQHDNLKGVDTKKYLEKLINNLFESYNISEGKIDLEMDIESILLDVDTMIPMGLMINELISNSLKHAFPDEIDGKLKVALYKKNEFIILEIKDDGVGAPDKLQLKEKSFGQSLVKAFATKLGGEIEYTEGKGFGIRLQMSKFNLAS